MVLCISPLKTTFNSSYLVLNQLLCSVLLQSFSGTYLLIPTQGNLRLLSIKKKDYEKEYNYPITLPDGISS